jgi:hypothetical protein
MADPLSVAGTAVGIVSLGIQVCQGLVSYLRSVDGRKKEIAGYLGEVQNLISVFTSLNEVLPRLALQNASDHDTIRQCLGHCEDELDRLKLLVQKLRGPQAQADLKAKMKDVARAMVYPFREGELASVHQCLQSLLGHLKLAISIASL